MKRFFALLVCLKPVGGWLSMAAFLLVAIMFVPPYFGIPSDYWPLSGMLMGLLVGGLWPAKFDYDRYERMTSDL